MESRMNPYAQSLVYKNAPDTFKTTYGTSYKQLPTFDVSPAYDRFRERDERQWFPRDLSPYPAARDDSPIRSKRPYQPMNYYEEQEFLRMQQEREREREYRSRFEDATLRRDEYREPPPQNRRNIDYEEQFETPRGRARERGKPEQQMSDRAEHLRAQYDDLVADGQPTDDLQLAVCNKCFKSNACMNRLGCGHQYCDDCMARMPGSDNPFRDSIRWHFCCDLCKKWTSEAKLVRTDPYGRRLMKFHDIGYFKTS